MKLNKSTQTFILNWSEIASGWGMNRTVAQIHALLLISETPLTADEIKLSLQVARSNVSVSLRELQNWGLINTIQVMGDRKKRFEAQKDIDLMFKRIMAERKKREVESALCCLGDCSKIAAQELAQGKVHQQINELTKVFEKLNKVYGQFIDNA